MTRAASSRRAFLRTAALTSTGMLAASALGQAGAMLASAQAPPRPSPDRALQMLMEGNARFVAGTATGPNRDLARRADMALGQHPYASVLSCSDSRVPPELVFDAGMGDLFVMRVAGNVVDDDMLGSIEYGAEHLDIPLIVVMGHERCGAVEATIQALTQGAAFSGHIVSLALGIEPAVQRVRNEPGDLWDNAVRANVVRSVEQLTSRSDILAEMLDHGEIKIVGAYYDLQTGRVSTITMPQTSGGH